VNSASIRPLALVVSALALACVTMVPVAHAGVRVWMDDSWDTRDAYVSPREDREYCRSRVSGYDEYRHRVVVRYVVIHPKDFSKVEVVSRRYVIQRVSTDGQDQGVRPTVAPAPARVYLPERSRVVSTSRSVNQVKRASFEAKQASRIVSSKRPQKVPAKQQGDPVRVASKSAK